MRTLVVVNTNARKGGRQTLQALERELPHARVVGTRTLADTEALLRTARDRSELVLAAGGDGTAVALLNAMRRVLSDKPRADGEPLFKLGLLKLGTGNGWARATGAPDIGRAAARLRRFVERGFGAAALPVTRYGLLEVEGTLAHFAGTGWDAELIDDYHAQKTEDGRLPASLRAGLFGYFNGLLTRAVPRNIRLPRVEVEIVNTGEPALGVDARGLPFEVTGGGTGAVLYRGPVSVCGVGTSTQWGFGFRAFPFARLVPGRFNLRMYVGTTQEALARVPLLWGGKHPLEKMLTWLLTKCEARFSRPVPLQAGGDLLGQRDRIVYEAAKERVDVLDWRALSPLVGERLRTRDALAMRLRPALAPYGIAAT